MTGRSIIDAGYSTAFADDTGAVDATLEAALARASSPTGNEAVSAALLVSRLLVPIVASPAAGEARGSLDGGHGADLALVTVLGRDGRRALPAFTGLEALARWRADARPVPCSARQAALAADEEGAVALVLDIAGPISHTVSGSRLAALAAGRAWQPAYIDQQVVSAVRGHLLALAGNSMAAYLRPSDEADAVVMLVPSPNVDAVRVESITRALAARLAADPELNARVDCGLDLAVASSTQQVLHGGIDQPG